MSVQHYYKKKLVDENIEVEYNSETDMIRIKIDRKLNNGVNIGSDYLDLHPSYVEPLHKLLTDVTDLPTQDPEAK